MLQQTRVQTVIPYYERFLRRFPSLRQLAGAEEKELLACWSGLGYYRRARNLRKAAGIIVERHKGEFPTELDEAIRLPGVGDYTAAAVLSIAYGKVLPVLDGNVVRVLSRLFALSSDAKTVRGKRRLRQLAASLLSPRRPGDFNQAMMELGATVCLPSQPQCGHCPVQAHCLACSRDAVARYPRSKPKGKPALRRYVAAIVLDRAGRVLLVRRSDRQRWLPGFWEVPMWESSIASAPRWLKMEKPLGFVRHTITDNRLEVAVFLALERGSDHSTARRWAAADELDSVPLTTVSRKALRLLRT